MMTKQDRDRFLNMLANGNFPNKGKGLAICLVIPAGVMNNSIVSDVEKDALINQGAKILEDLSSGVYARIGWSSYFAFMQGDSEKAKKDIEASIKKATSINKHCSLWTFAVSETENGNAKKVFEELEVSLN